MWATKVSFPSVPDEKESSHPWTPTTAFGGLVSDWQVFPANYFTFSHIFCSLLFFGGLNLFNEAKWPTNLTVSVIVLLDFKLSGQLPEKAQWTSAYKHQRLGYNRVSAKLKEDKGENEKGLLNSIARRQMGNSKMLHVKMYFSYKIYANLLLKILHNLLDPPIGLRSDNY